MGNRSYLEFAQRGLSDEFDETYELVDFMIKFERQTFLADTVTCKYYKSDTENNTYLIKEYNSQGEEVCIIQAEWSKTSSTTEDFSTIVIR